MATENVQVGWWHLEMHGKRVHCNHYANEIGEPCGRRDRGTWYPVWRSSDGDGPWTEAPDPSPSECTVPPEDYCPHGPQCRQLRQWRAAVNARRPASDPAPIWPDRGST